MALNDIEPLDLTGLTAQLATSDLSQTMDGFAADFEQEHYGSTGEHGDVRLDSLAARGTRLPITGILQFLGGAWLFDAEGNNSHTIGLRPIQWTATQNDYNPPGMSDALIVEVDTDADRSITGLQRIARQKRLLIFGNRGNYNVTFKHNNAGSLYYNRFAGPNAADMILGSGEYAWLYYDVGSEIWRAVSLI